MPTPSELEHLIDTHMGCFGQFNAYDPICKFRCATNIRCSIACDEMERSEIMEDLMTVETYVDRLQ